MNTVSYNRLFFLSIGLLLFARPFFCFGVEIKTRNSAYSIYDPVDQKLVAIIRVDRSYSESKRVGFFRVKALPLFISTGVRIESARSSWSGRHFSLVQRRLQSLGGQVAFEIRNLEWRGPDSAVLLAEKVRSDRTGTGLLLDNVRLKSATGEIVLKKSKLLPAQDRLQLVSTETGKPSVFLFGPTVNPLTNSGNSL